MSYLYCLFVSSYKGINPVHGAPPLGPHDLPKPYMQQHHTGIRVSAYKFGGNTKIQFIALASIK